ncbi:MAG: hydantoinase B/oxoprolinase family protein [Thermoleophilia bacterium]|nr:hydantoinase B/oxoprolinase family protein [Thermoleophilia bacterium]
MSGHVVAGVEVDPITVEVLRNELNSAAEQMKIVLQRTSFSPVIYENLDLACALYDRQVRLLAQADALPIFLGTMNACVEACVAAAGGVARLEPGDIFFNSSPYDIGSHAQDAAVVMPVFADGAVVGYAAIKAHHLDLGAKEPYVTDSVDLFQEGVILPGVRLYRRGELQEDLHRTIVANTRMPAALVGDLNAEVAAARAGAALLAGLVDKHGLASFTRHVERLFDHGEALVRHFLRELPDGRHAASGCLDSDGLGGDPVSVRITVEIDDDRLVVDFGTTPQQRGPVNCPLPLTLSAARFAVMAVTAAGERVNEGHLRALGIRAPEGTLFHPVSPAPVFLCFLAGELAIDLIHEALADAVPGAIPAGSGGDLCALAFWGEHDGEFWTGSVDHLTGQGAGAAGDGTAPLIHISCSGGRNASSEVLEARHPLRVEATELVTDSGGAGRSRGGPGVRARYRVLSDTRMTAIVERTRTPPRGGAGGSPGLPNAMEVRFPDGRREQHGKVTDLALPAGTVVELCSGGGGGYGPPAERPSGAVHTDVAQGYITEARARADYPHAFTRPIDREES